MSPHAQEMLAKLVDSVSVEMAHVALSDADVYKEVAKRLSEIVTAGMDNEQALEPCDMCGKMAVPHPQPEDAA